MTACDKEKTTQQFLMFWLAGERYALPLSDVREVLAEVELTPVPFAPPCILGIINVRGQILSLVDLKIRFGLTGQHSLSGHEPSILILEKQSSVFAITIDHLDSVIDVQEIEQSRFIEDPTNQIERCTHFTANMNDTSVAFLKTEALIAFAETNTTQLRETSLAVE